MVCDGHSGVEAANFVASNFHRLLSPKLPAKLPNFALPKEVDAFAEQIRKALCETFVRLDNEWTNVGHLSGTTVTVVLCVGWLLTIANVGDSAAVLDTGCSILELTKSHRIQNNTEEQSRLRTAGCQLASLGFHLQGPARPNEPGVGPMRIWPGGLCVSRSVGDLDAGPEVVPVPHIRQVLLPGEGCRVIMASDGLWDVLSFSKSAKLTRSKPTGASASALVSAVSRDLRTMDDASIIIIDVLPSESTSFPTVALKANPRSTEKSGGIFACFKPELDEPDSREARGAGHLTFYSDVDCLRAYPGLRGLLARGSLQHLGSTLGMSARHPPNDYTLHGGQLYPGAFGNGMAKSISMAGPMDHYSHSHDVTQHSSVSDQPLPDHPHSPLKTASERAYDNDGPIVTFGSAPNPSQHKLGQA